MRLRAVFPMALIALAASCASAGTVGTAPRRDSNVVTQAEIEQSSAADAYTAVQRLRPAWLHRVHDASINNPEPLMAYLGNIRLGSVDALHNLSTDGIARMEYLSGVEAQQRFGMGNSNGAIVVTMVSQ